MESDMEISGTTTLDSIFFSGMLFILLSTNTQM